MPRPITKADIMRWRREGYHVDVKYNDLLGITAIFSEPSAVYSYYVNFYSYSVYYDGTPIFVTKKTLATRMKIGHPKPRKPRKKKQIMSDPEFGLDEIGLAQEIISQMD